jgi:DNA-3-methyladenine glycosylase
MVKRNRSQRSYPEGSILLSTKLPPDFYQRSDVVQVARELIGKVLFSCIDETVTAGIIVETEAYNGTEDRACHAYRGRKTPRTEVMFEPGGVAYVYLCYGIHSLLNVVTGPKGMPQAVLIRAIKPLEGIEAMTERRKGKMPLAAGPGTVAQALGITTKHSGISLLGNKLWIEDHGLVFDSIQAGPRIGVDYAGDDALLPYRFFLGEDGGGG